MTHIVTYAFEGVTYIITYACDGFTYNIFDPRNDGGRKEMNRLENVI